MRLKKATSSLFVQMLLVACVLFMLYGFVMPLRVKTQVASGDLIEIKSPSALQSFNSAKCSIEIKSKSGASARIELLQSWYDLPFLVVALTNHGIFYCIYDHDTDWQLLKIDVNRAFDRPAMNQVMSANILASTCKIERLRPSEKRDWTNVAAMVQMLPSKQYRHQVIGGLRIGCFRIPTPQMNVVGSMLKYGEQGGGYASD